MWMDCPRCGHQDTRPRAASTWSRSGRPAARETSWPAASRTRVVGVRSTRSARTSLQVVLGVDLDVRDTRDQGGDVAEHPTGGAARRAEGRGELHERGPLPQGYGDPGLGQHGRGRLERRRSIGLASTRAPGGCRGTVRPWRPGTSRSPPRTARSRGAPTVRSSRRANRVAASRTFAGFRGPLSRRRRAAGTPRPRPAATSTGPGRADPTGRSPTRAEQTPSTASSPVSGCRATARSRRSARVTGPVTGRSSVATPAAARAAAQ